MILVGAGSNLGDSVAYIETAILQLQKALKLPVARSRLWRTAPVDCPPDSPDFINLVIMFSASASVMPFALLSLLQSLEQAAGRKATSRLNAPRTLDLDLLVFNDLVIWSERLVLPHPKAHLRHFVLAPIAELAPDLCWPGLAGETVSTLLSALPERDRGKPII